MLVDFVKGAAVSASTLKTIGEERREQCKVWFEHLRYWGPSDIRFCRFQVQFDEQSNFCAEGLFYESCLHWETCHLWSWSRGLHLLPWSFYSPSISSPSCCTWLFERLPSLGFWKLLPTAVVGFVLLSCTVLPPSFLQSMLALSSFVVALTIFHGPVRAYGSDLLRESARSSFVRRIESLSWNGSLPFSSSSQKSYSLHQLHSYKLFFLSEVFPKIQISTLIPRTQRLSRNRKWLNSCAHFVGMLGELVSNRICSVCIDFRTRKNSMHTWLTSPGSGSLSSTPSERKHAGGGLPIWKSVFSLRQCLRPTFAILPPEVAMSLLFCDLELLRCAQARYITGNISHDLLHLYGRLCTVDHKASHDFNNWEIFLWET